MTTNSEDGMERPGPQAGSASADAPADGGFLPILERRCILVDAVTTVLAGGITYMSCLVNAMARLAPGWRFEVFAGSEDLQSRLDRLPNIRVYLVPGRSRSLLRFAYRQFVLPVRALISNADAALVQFPGLFFKTTPQVMLALNSHYVIDPPVAKTFRGAMKQRVRRFLFTVGYRVVDRTVFVSNQMKTMAHRWFGPACTRGVVVYEGVNPRLLDSTSGSDASGGGGEPYFLAVGSVSEHKNYPTMVRAFASFRRNCSMPTRLMIAGSFPGLEAFRCGRGAKPTLISLAEELGVASSIDFLGLVPDEKLFALLRGAMAFVSTSLLEAFNLTVAEAMAIGVPVVVPNTSSYPEVVGDAGAYHDPTDPESVATQLRLVREDDTLRRRLTALGRARGLRYTWELAGEKIIATLAEVIGGHGARGRRADERGQVATTI